MLDQLASEAAAAAGVPVSTDDFSPVVDAHLRLRFEVVNDDIMLATGASVDALRALLSEHIETELRERVETDFATGQTVDFRRPADGNRGRWARLRLPRLSRTGGQGATVGVTMAASAGEQHELMWAGVRRLLRCALPDPGKRLVDGLNTEARLALTTSPYDSAQSWVDDVVMCTLDELIGDLAALPPDRASVATLSALCRSGFPGPSSTRAPTPERCSRRPDELVAPSIRSTHRHLPTPEPTS